jgi:hypothetical protein
MTLFPSTTLLGWMTLIELPFSGRLFIFIVAMIDLIVSWIAEVYVLPQVALSIGKLILKHEMWKEKRHRWNLSERAEHESISMPGRFFDEEAGLIEPRVEWTPKHLHWRNKGKLYKIVKAEMTQFI